MPSKSKNQHNRYAKIKKTGILPDLNPTRTFVVAE